MSTENKPNRLFKYGIPVAVAIGLIFALSQFGKSSQENSSFTSETLPTMTAPVPDEYLEQSSYAKTDESSGVTHPFTGIFYPRAINPPGYSDWNCFRIPPGGTSYGAILVGGSSARTTTDTKNGVVFIKNVPYSFPADSDPKNWPPETWHVQPGDVGCSK